MWRPRMGGNDSAFHYSAGGVRGCVRGWSSYFIDDNTFAAQVRLGSVVHFFDRSSHVIRQSGDMVEVQKMARPSWSDRPVNGPWLKESHPNVP